MGEWQPIETAKKNGEPILLCLKKTLSAEFGRPDMERWDGLQFVGRHIGLPGDGFDIGWQFAAPVGHGGFLDEWIAGWQPLSEPPDAEIEKEMEDDL